MATLTYRQARTIVVGFGTALIFGVAVAAFFRGADLVEVAAILLFLPVLAALAVWQVRGGLAAAVVVSAVYVAVRIATLPGIPVGDFLGSIVVRVLLYVGLGLFGGWANELLAQALRKLELYDEIDDATGVGNARALLSIAGREVARADRYRTVFSVIVVRVDGGAFAPVGAKRGTRALRRLAQTIEQSVRTTDLVARIPTGDAEEVVCVLPETGREGAVILGERLVAGAREILAEHGLDAVNGQVSGQTITYPGDDQALADYRDHLERVLRGATVTVEEEDQR